MNLFKSFDSGLGQYMRKAARPLGGMESSIHTAGGASDSTTMVVILVVCLCCCRWTRDVMSSTYIKKWNTK